MKLFTLCLASVVWAGVSWAFDSWMHNLGFAFVIGAVASIFVIASLEYLAAAKVHDEFEREQLQHIAEEMDKSK